MLLIGRSVWQNATDLCAGQRAKWCLHQEVRLAGGVDAVHGAGGFGVVGQGKPRSNAILL